MIDDEIRNLYQTITVQRGTTVLHAGTDRALALGELHIGDTVRIQSLLEWVRAAVTTIQYGTDGATGTAETAGFVYSLEYDAERCYWICPGGVAKALVGK